MEHYLNGDYGSCDALNTLCTIIMTESKHYLEKEQKMKVCSTCEQNANPHISPNERRYHKERHNLLDIYRLSYVVIFNISYINESQ
jgi:hypothetical protein